MYLYPAGLTDGFLSRLSQVGPPLAPYFDVPLQHAHADVLSAMGRPFARDPRKVVERIRARFPDAALRTSLITGYPGETEDAFRTLRDFVAETRFHHMGVFVFEPEDGTPAAELPGRVDRETAEARREELMSLQAGISEEILGELVGTAQGVVVDEPSPEWPGLHVGRCWFQAPEADGVTWVSGPGVHPGALVRARIDEAKTYDLVALAE
jgi:tRNA-2-methylthio-N6-dimethylallyladenosine synthase/ribosomal protein S12 methylthiotransferase